MDDIAAFLGSHPEIAAAVSYGLRNLTVTRPDDPVAFLAEQLRAFNAKNKYESCVVKLAVAPPAAQQECKGHFGVGSSLKLSYLAMCVLRGRGEAPEAKAAEAKAEDVAPARGRGGGRQGMRRSVRGYVLPSCC